MNFGTHVEINFHQQSQVSVFLEVPASSSLAVFSEATLIAALAIRVLSNMGKSEYSDSLARVLCSADELIPAIFGGESPTELIGYPGHPGRIVFAAHAQWVNGSFKTNVTSSGFDWSNTGYGQYGPTSVVAFMQYLVRKYKPQSFEELQNSKPLNAICRTCMAIGQWYIQGRVTMFASHHQLANEASYANCIMAGIDLSELNEPSPVNSSQGTGHVMDDDQFSTGTFVNTRINRQTSSAPLIVSIVSVMLLAGVIAAFMNRDSLSPKRTPVESTAISSIGYDAENSVLQIEFTSREVYQYFDVPPAVASGLMSADSKGTYFNAVITNAGYQFRRMPRDAETVISNQPASPQQTGPPQANETYSDPKVLRRLHSSDAQNKTSRPFVDLTVLKLRQEAWIKRERDAGTISAKDAEDLLRLNSQTPTPRYR